MKKTSFLKKLTAMAATLAMTCVMAVGAFAAEPAVDYKLDSAAISVGSANVTPPAKSANGCFQLASPALSPTLMPELTEVLLPPLGLPPLPPSQ